MRIGNGFDVHALVPDRKLIIGGVHIPHEKGLAGHSDADVLTHAIMDALLGAAGLGDIGRHFPDSDEIYQGISSLRLMEKVSVLLQKKALMIEHIDAVIIAQEPRMAPFLEEMKKCLSTAMAIGVERINLKATTTENLGFIGRREGIAAQAVVLMSESAQGPGKGFIAE